MASGDDQPFKRPKFLQIAWEKWTGFTGFLSDVRAEMRKVVTPTTKEVQATTSVVIVTVFIFGLFFFLVDMIFNRALHELLVRAGGAQ